MTINGHVCMYLNQKHSGCKKRSGQELKKGPDKKEVNQNGRPRPV